MCADTFTSHMSKSVGKPIEHVCRFVQISKPRELKLLSEITKSESEKDRKQKVSHHPRRATRAIYVPSVNRIFISIKSKWYTRYVRDELGVICACLIIVVA